MKTRERRHGINSVLILGAICLLFFTLFARQVTSKNLFVPGPSSYEKDDSILEVYSKDGTKLAVYWAPVRGAERTVFYFHGNAEDIGDVLPVLNNYRLQGLNVLCFDYRGYGLSEGKASEKLVYQDANKVLDYAIDQFGVRENQLILHGRSLGGGVAMELATSRSPLGLILESTFLSVFKIYLPLTWIPGDKFTNASKADKVACPTLVVHGTQDGVISIEHGKELATLIHDDLVKTLWVEGAGHNNLEFVAGGDYWATIRGFVRILGSEGVN